MPNQKFLMEKISILVPCCNVEKYIRECLDSIKNQTFSNLEIICIDDGSTDSTGSIIDEYVAADERFKVIHKPNSGYGDSMNKGLDICTGDYIGIVESDDWIEAEMFETLLDTAKKHNLDLVRCCWFEGPTGTEREEQQDWVKKNVVCCPFDDESIFLQQPSIWVSLYRRDLLESGRKVRFLPTPGASYQDTSFAFKAYTKSKRFMMIDKALHHYRVNPNSSVSSSGKVYCIIDEWEEMKRWVCEDSSMRKRFSRSPLLPMICKGGVEWNYNRLSHTVLKLLFLRRASRFFRSATEEGVFGLHSFAKSRGGKVISKVMTAPLDYHYDQIMTQLNILSNYDDCSKTSGNNQQQDLISIVVPCYNTSKYIYSSLMSIVQQSYRNIEIICVDDCSTDDTETLVRHIMRRDKRISWYSTCTNSGLSASRNLGLEHCNGKYVLFVDGDDCLMPGAVARLHEAMEDGDDIVAGSAIVNYEGGGKSYGDLVGSDKRYYTIKRECRIDALKDIDKAVQIHVSAWGKLWRLSVIKDNHISFPEGLLYEDACFYWKYLLVAPKLHVIKEPVYLYQRHKVGSIMSNTFDKRPGLAIQHVLILDNIYRFIRENHFEEEGVAILSRLYEPFFWFAYNNSPKSDLDALYKNMCRILTEQHVDTSESPVMDYILRYEETNKSELFMEAYSGYRPIIYKLERKVKKYRKLTKIFVLTSALLIITLIVLLLC